MTCSRRRRRSWRASTSASRTRGWQRAIDCCCASCRRSSSMRASSISLSACTPRSGASPRCRTCSTSSAPRRCSRSRCWCSTTSWWRRRSTARSSSARSRSCSTGSCRWCSWRAAHRLPLFPLCAHAAACRAASDAVPTLVLGRAADAEVLLRAIESGAVSRMRPVGILSPSMADRGQSIRGIPVLGSLDDLEQVVRDCEARGTHIGAADLHAVRARAGRAPESILMRARRLGLQTSRLPSLDEGGEALQLAPVEVEDLLLRPSVKIDYRAARKRRARQVDHRHRRRRLDRRGNLRPRRDVRRGAAAGGREFRAGAAYHPRNAARQGRERRDRRPHRRCARPRAHHGGVRGLQARHRVPRRRAQARAAARTRLGRGHQDQRVRLGQCRRRRGCGRRDRAW